MIDFGFVKPGTTLYIPFASFAGSTGASATLTGLATTDVEIYKDGSTTQRASDAGYALLDTDGIDFDSITGIHGLSIDLADNTTAGFYAAGSQYWVVISSVTVDSQTVNFIAATFRIGYPDAVLNTTIATLSSQTSFTLTAGPAEDDALNGRQIFIHDVASAVQVGHAVILDYTGSTKTVTLAAATTFTIAAGDNVAVCGLAPLQPTTPGDKLTLAASRALADVRAWNSNTAGIVVDSNNFPMTVGRGIYDSGLDASFSFNATNLSGGEWVLAEVADIQSGLSTLTQTQVTGGAYAINSASFAFNAALDFTTTQKAATLARVTLVDTLTTYTSNTPQTGDGYAIVNSGTHGNAALKTLIDTVDTVADAIKLKTDNLPASPAATGDIPTAVQNADALIGRNIAGGSSTGRTVKQALASIRNKVAFDVPTAGSFTVYDTDDTTSLWTGTYTASASADPVTAIDPA